MKYIAIEDYKSGEWITKGKVYEVINGGITFDNGMIYSFNNNLNYKPTKSFFKPYIEELPQPTKSMLRDGDYVINREGTKCIVSLDFGKFVNYDGNFFIIEDFTDTLICPWACPEYEIMEVYRDSKLIAKRTEKEYNDKIEKIESKLLEMLSKLDELEELVNEK